MKKFEVQQLLRSIRCLLMDASLLGALDDSPARKQFIIKSRNLINDLLKYCKENDFPISVCSVERLLLLFHEDAPEHLVAENLYDAVTRAIIILEDEMSTRLFLQIPYENKDYFDTPLAGWEKILDQFPDCKEDIEEMNRCFALTRYTASMFHALRVAEYGAIVLGDYIGATNPRKGWGATIKRLSALVKGTRKNFPTTLSVSFEFVEQLNREVDSLAMAWRHKVAHPRNSLVILPNASFAPEVAGHIIQSIKVFMMRLMEEGVSPKKFKKKP
jgi:hypothetical protein